MPFIPSAGPENEKPGCHLPKNVEISRLVLGPAKKFQD
jgi:hypothetical protein